jgi:hypothetical protein
MSRRFAPLLLLLIAPAVSAAPVPKSLKKVTPASPDGTWKLVEFWSSGQKGNAQGMTAVWVLEGEAFYVGPKAESNYWQLTTPDPDKPTVRRFAHGRTNPTPYPAMVEVDGDTLKFCYAHDGATAITECAPAKSVHYYVFTRLNPDDPTASPPK